MYDSDDDLDYEIPFAAATDAMAIVEPTDSRWPIRAVNESFERAFDRHESEIRGSCLTAVLGVTEEWPLQPPRATGSAAEGHVDLPDLPGESFVRVTPFETDSARPHWLVTIADAPGVGGQSSRPARDEAGAASLRSIGRIASADDFRAACNAGARAVAATVDFDAFVVDPDDRPPFLAGVAMPIQLPERADRTAAFRGTDLHDSNNDRTWGTVGQFPVGDRGRLQIAARTGFDPDPEARRRIEQCGRALGAAIDRLARERALAAERDELAAFNRILRHDVLNGLNLIWARLDLLETDLSAENREHFETVTERIDEMIDQVEAVRAIRNDGAADTTARPLAPIVRAAVDSAGGRHPDVAFSIDGSIPDLSVVADQRVEFCLRNVLHTSAQHADIEMPAVRVTVDRRGDHAAIRVADNGSGVPDDVDRSVLKSGPPDERDGHALFLTERVVAEIYDGAVRADERGDGAAFVVELPLATEA